MSTGIEAAVKEHVQEVLVGILERVAMDYGLDGGELVARYAGGGEDSGGNKKPEAPDTESMKESAVEKKKRGRRKKQKEEFLETEEYEFEGVTYLVDAQNLVYTYDIEAPTFVGHRLADGTIKLLA